jgi:hypothetical protein
MEKEYRSQQKSSKQGEKCMNVLSLNTFCPNDQGQSQVASTVKKRMSKNTRKRGLFNPYGFRRMNSFVSSGI